MKSGGTDEMAQEIFNDSLVLLIEKIQKPNFELTAKMTTYLYGINRFLMKNELRKQKKYNYELEWNDTLILNQEDLSYDFEKEKQLTRLEKILILYQKSANKFLDFFTFKKKTWNSLLKH